MSAPTEVPGQIGLLTHADHLFKMGWPLEIRHPSSWGVPSSEVLWELASLYRLEDARAGHEPDDIEDYWLMLEDELGVSLPRGNGPPRERTGPQAREAA